jgi:hypothetical protein
MTFRPYPGLTIACVLLFAILCGLGAWQLERLQWKLALIARVNGHMAAAPVTLDAITALPADEAQYRKVTLHGRFDHSHEAYVFTTADGAPVYHVLTPFKTDTGKVLMVDRGEVPKERLDPATRAAGNSAGDFGRAGGDRGRRHPQSGRLPRGWADGGQLPQRSSQLCRNLVRAGLGPARHLVRLSYFQGPDRFQSGGLSPKPAL